MKHLKNWIFFLTTILPIAAVTITVLYLYCAICGVGETIDCLEMCCPRSKCCDIRRDCCQSRCCGSGCCRKKQIHDTEDDEYNDERIS